MLVPRFPIPLNASNTSTGIAKIIVLDWSELISFIVERVLKCNAPADSLIVRAALAKFSEATILPSIFLVIVAIAMIFAVGFVIFYLYNEPHSFIVTQTDIKLKLNEDEIIHACEYIHSHSKRVGLSIKPNILARLSVPTK